MSSSKKDLVSYRVQRAFGTLDDAKLLIENKKWNSAINRLYYSVFYAASALILLEDQAAFTHNGVKTSFSEKFVKTGKMDLSEGKLYSQLFSWRQKGDYDDLFDFDEATVAPYIEPVEKFIQKVALLVKAGPEQTPGSN